jgi:metal-responsive CopG/Arc/MetJ family transcriptional regulator
MVEAGSKPIDECKTERRTVTLEQPLLAKIDDYRFAARFACRTDAIRHLLRLALKLEPPEQHFATLDHMVPKAIPPHSYTKAAVDTSKRVHISLTQPEKEAVEHYFKSARLWSRCETVRVLLKVSLNQESLRAHLNIPRNYDKTSSFRSNDGDVVRGPAPVLESIRPALDDEERQDLARVLLNTPNP